LIFCSPLIVVGSLLLALSYARVLIVSYSFFVHRAYAFLVMLHYREPSQESTV